MELAFESKPLRTICENEAEARRELGDRVLEMLKHRLADLRAAISAKDVVVGRARLFNNSGSEYMALELTDGYQLVLAPNHPNNPMTAENRVDWTKVTRVKLLRIERNNV